MVHIAVQELGFQLLLLLLLTLAFVAAAVLGAWGDTCTGTGCTRGVCLRYAEPLDDGVNDAAGLAVVLVPPNGLMVLAALQTSRSSVRIAGGGPFVVPGAQFTPKTQQSASSTPLFTGFSKEAEGGRWCLSMGGRKHGVDASSS